VSRRLNITFLSALIISLIALGTFGCKEPEAIGGPDLDSPQDTFVWVDTSELEIRVVEIQGDSVKIVKLRSPEDTNRIYTEKRYTIEELDSWHRDNMVRLVRIEPDLIEALQALTADSCKRSKR